jgi:hypothetical protein
VIEALKKSIEQNKYVYFLFKGLALLLMVFIADRCIGTLLNHYYFRQTSGALYRTTVAMEQTGAKVLVLGSSRANHHYYPVFFEERLKQSFYNTGRDATSIFYDQIITKAVLKRYRPKLMVLDLNREAFMENDADYDKLSEFLPYYNTHPEIRGIINLKRPLERVKLLSKIYPFNSYLITIAVGNTEFNKKRKGDTKGYVPISKKWTQPLQSETAKTYKIDQNKVNTYKDIIASCKAAGVRLVIVSSPYFIRFKSEDNSLALAKLLAKKESIAFYDFSQDAYFLNRSSLFTDTYHLNNDGAMIFTNKLLDSLDQ